MSPDGCCCLRNTVPELHTPSKVHTQDQQLQFLRLKRRNLGLNELYSECTTRSELVATFIAVLELCSIGSILVSVSRKGDGYDLSFAGGDVDEILEMIEE